MIRMRTLPLAAAVLAVMFGGIFATKALGLWNTTNTKQPVKFKTGELAGLPNPADIRGSYTWLDVEKAFGVSGVEMAALFSAPGFVLDPAARVSTLETYYKEKLPADREVGTDSVRLFVSRMTGLPHTPEEGTALPSAAVDYLAARGKADEVALAAKMDLTQVLPAGTDPANVPAPATVVRDESDIKVGGSTTFGNLRSWGLSDAEIEKISGFKPGPDSGNVRDAAKAAGKSFSDVKEKLQAAALAKKK